MKYIIYLMLVAFVSCEMPLRNIDKEEIFIVTNVENERRYIKNQVKYTIRLVATKQGWTTFDGERQKFGFTILDKRHKYQIGDTLSIGNCN